VILAHTDQAGLIGQDDGLDALQAGWRPGRAPGGLAAWIRTAFALRAE